VVEANRVSHDLDRLICVEPTELIVGARRPFSDGEAILAHGDPALHARVWRSVSNGDSPWRAGSALPK